MIVDPNSTMVVVADNLGPISGFMKTLSALVGGVFGVYLILLYLRWREYHVLKSVLIGVRRDLRVIAASKGVELEPIREPKFIQIGKYFKRKAKETVKTEKEIEIGSGTHFKNNKKKDKKKR